MKLIVGLGNPGEQYVRTRHNAGFMVMDALAKKAGVEINKKKFDALYAKTKIKGEDIILLKPMTYMNNSGFALRACMDFFKIAPEDLIVIYDDMDTPVGSIRLKPSGSAGGHNGMKSVIQAAMQQDFSRIRVGIGRDPNYKIVDYVLSRFRAEEMDDLNHAIDQAVKAAWFAIDHPFSAAMNRYNVKPKKKKAPKPAADGMETYHPAKSDAIFRLASNQEVPSLQPEETRTAGSLVFDVTRDDPLSSSPDAGHTDQKKSPASGMQEDEELA